MKPGDGKIAIFICGPVRYAVYVNRSIERIFSGYDYDCFYHIWKEDLGNKVRAGEVKDLEEIERHPRTKVFIRQEPYRVEDFADSIGTESKTNSSVNALMGMFCSVNLLCHYLEQLPDFSAYRYILRLRTDCAIFHPDFPSLLDTSKETLTVSRNCFSRVTEICDHICFGRVEDFFSLWRFANMQEVYKTYQEGERNTDLALLRRIQKNPGIRICGNIVRFRDYHIVYFPTRDSDPKSISDAINKYGMEEFFRHPRRDLDFGAIGRFVAEWDRMWQQKKELEKKSGHLSQKQTVSIKDKTEVLGKSTANDLTVDSRALAYTLERLLACQIERLMAYDVDGVSEVAEKAVLITRELGRRRIFERTEFAEQFDRIKRQYREICRIIAERQQEVQEKQTC